MLLFTFGRTREEKKEGIIGKEGRVGSKWGKGEGGLNPNSGTIHN